MKYWFSPPPLWFPEVQNFSSEEPPACRSFPSPILSPRNKHSRQQWPENIKIVIFCDFKLSQDKPDTLAAPASNISVKLKCNTGAFWKRSKNAKLVDCPSVFYSILSFVSGRVNEKSHCPSGKMYLQLCYRLGMLTLVRLIVSWNVNFEKIFSRQSINHKQDREI